MKKYLLGFAMLIATTAVNAQEGSFKPAAGSFNLEVGFNPFTVSQLGQNGFYLQDGQIKAGYAINDNIGVRLGLEFNLLSNKQNNGESGNALIETKNSTSAITFVPGVTYSFAGTNKLTPYVGAEFLFGTTSNTNTVTVGSTKTVTKNYSPAFNTFGFDIFSGFNFYFAQNLYIGAEVGLGIKSTSYKKSSVETTGSPKVESKDSNKDFSFGFYANPSIRLGWAF